MTLILTLLEWFLIIKQKIKLTHLESTSKEDLFCIIKMTYDKKADKCIWQSIVYEYHKLALVAKLFY